MMLRLAAQYFLFFLSENDTLLQTCPVRLTAGQSVGSAFPSRDLGCTHHFVEGKQHSLSNFTARFLYKQCIAWTAHLLL